MSFVINVEKNIKPANARYLVDYPISIINKESNIRKIIFILCTD